MAAGEPSASLPVASLLTDMGGSTQGSGGSGGKPPLQSPSFLDRLIAILPFLLMGGLLVLLALFVPNFFTSRNIMNVFVQASSLAIMAMGMSVVMIGGGIDLSIPPVMALSAIAGAMHLRDGGSIPVACLLMLSVGVLAGCINGVAVAYLKMIPFVVTLAMLTIATGTAVWVTNSVSVPVTNETYLDVIGDRTFAIALMLMVAAVSWVVVRRSLFGRWLYAVGINAKAARVAGVPTNRVLFGTYAISGLLAGLTGVLLSARLNAASANMGNDGIVLDIVSSAVVGGVSIYGGTSSPLGAMLGAIFITVISNSLNLMGVSFFTSLIVKGAVIILFVALDSLKKR